MKGGERALVEKSLGDACNGAESKRGQDSDSENREKTEERKVSVSICLCAGSFRRKLMDNVSRNSL